MIIQGQCIDLLWYNYSTYDDLHQFWFHFVWAAPPLQGIHRTSETQMQSYWLKLFNMASEIINLWQNHASKGGYPKNSRILQNWIVLLLLPWTRNRKETHNLCSTQFTTECRHLFSESESSGFFCMFGTQCIFAIGFWWMFLIDLWKFLFLVCQFFLSF